jgi:hypothetical protein
MNSVYRTAVLRNGALSEPPVVLLGAAGSGKSETILEILQRLFSRDHIARLGRMPHVLLCAPSNGAADLLALRLLDKPFAELAIAANLLRLNSHQRPETELLGGDRLLKVTFSFFFFFFF